MPGNNTSNLIKNSDLTPEERKAKASKAGKKSGEVRAKRKLLKDELLCLLDKKVEDGKMTAREAMSAKLVARAVEGDSDAYKLIRDTIGEKPTEKLSVGLDEDTIAKMDDFFDFLKDKGK